MARLYKREVAVTLTPPADNSFFALQTTSTTVTDLRVQFSVEKNLSKEPNTCEVNIFNFAEATRALSQRNPLHVRVEAGYDGDPKRLFAGDVRFARSIRNGPNWITELQLGDGSRAFRRARSNKSFGRGVKSRQVIKQLIVDMGLTAPVNLNLLDELDNTYSAGLAVEGPTQRELTRLLSPYGLQWSIQDGRFQVLRERDVRFDNPVLVSQDTGMIGSPEFGSPAKKGKPPILHIRMLLFPAMTPGQRITVNAKNASGTFKVTRVLHTGDTHAEDWQTAMEAVQV